MPEFTRAFLDNPLFRTQALSCDPMGAYVLDGREVEAGAFPQENGDVRLRLVLPGAERVTLSAAVSNSVRATVELTGDGDVFEGVLPYDERMTGPANVKLRVNGAEVLTPDLPVIWTENRPQNCIEIPDPDGAYLLIRDVPHGTYHRELINSAVQKRPERCMVFTPPGYAESSQAYPVLYLLHGGGDNEQMWEYVGRMSAILDNLWADGLAVPFIVVSMNGMLRRDGKPHPHPVDRAFENMLLRDCIPFIEGHYRVKTDKYNRAIAGLSMGAYMSCDIGFGHPELFGSIGTFTASMTGNPGRTTYEPPYPRVLREGADTFAARYRLYFRSTTPQENHLEYFEADDELLHRAGIDTLPCYNRILYPPRTSKWNSWRMGLRDFARLVFQY